MRIGNNKIISQALLMICSLAIGTGCFFVQTNMIADACSSAAECQADINAAQEKRAELVKQQKELEGKSTDTRAQVENIVAQLNTYQSELTILDIEMNNLRTQQMQLEQSIGENDQKVKDRLLSTQLSMETNSLTQFLVNASSISEMIERLQTVGDLTESNQDIIKTLESQKEELIKNEQKQKERKVLVDRLVNEQEQLKSSKKQELEQYMKEKQNTAVAEQEVSKQIALSQKQFTEIEEARKKAEELERIRIEEAKKAAAARKKAAQQSGSVAKPVEATSVPSTPIPSNGTALQNERAAFRYFVAQGYTRESAAAIIGNFYVESGMDPTKKQYGGGPGRGLAQWGYGMDGSRFNDLIAYARSKGKSEWALDIQLEWTVYEMQNYPAFRGMNNAMKSTNDISYATYYFGRIFEAPANLSASINERVNYAKQVYGRN